MQRRCLVSGQCRPGKKGDEALSFKTIKSYERNLHSEARRGPEVVIATRNLVLPWLTAFGIDMMLRSIRMGLLLLGFAIGSFSGARAQQTITSTHFIVSGVGLSAQELQSALLQCDDARRELAKKWYVTEHQQGWSPKCVICIHRSREAYTAAIGMPGAKTEGCSSIEVDKGKVVGRRIDLLSTQAASLPALKHELTHVVIADRFNGQLPPHWFDEGIAMLADPREKQLLHLRDCFECVGTRRSIPLQTLMSLEQFTSPDQMAPFYGQSLTLVAMLTEKQPTSVLMTFALEAKSVGYAAALQKHYGIDGLQSLEREWLTYVWQRRAAGHPVDAAIGSK